MTYSKEILKLAEKNNGIITTSEVTKAGIHRSYLKILLDKGLLERVDRGVYVIPTVFGDEMFNLQVRYKRGIFSHETALFIHNLTDRTPGRYTMTFPLGYNTRFLKRNNALIFKRVKKEYFDIGIVNSKTLSGNPIRVYSMERTLCDILKKRSDTDIQIITDAFKMYSKLKYKNIPLLSEYAKLFHVENKVRSYLEVLL